MNDQQDMITDLCWRCGKVTLMHKFAAACPKCIKLWEEINPKDSTLKRK